MKSIFTIILFANLLFANTGADVYARCAGCHGVNGETSALGRSAKIGGQSAKKTIKQLVGYQKGNLDLHGFGFMMKPQVKNINTDDIARVSLYIQGLKNTSNSNIPSKLSLSSCKNEKDATKRLNCFDKLSKQKNDNVALNREEKKEIPIPVIDKGKWVISDEISEIDDSRNVTLFLSADNEISSSYKTVTPTLILRCSENKTETYINWDMFLGSSSIKVLLRHDKEKAKTRRWDTSTDHKATFVRGNIPFIKKLLKHKKLLIKITPYSASPVTTTFDLRGLEEAIKPLRKACHW